MLSFTPKKKKSNNNKRQSQIPRSRAPPPLRPISHRRYSRKDSLEFETRRFEDEDDEYLQKLVGNATHISLERKSSKGMIRVPSKERFSALIRARRSSSMQSSGESDA